MEPGTVRRSTDFSAARPYLLALLTSALVGLLLRLRILHNYLMQHYTTDLFLNFIRDSLFVSYLLLLLVFLLVFGRLAAGPTRQRLTSRVVMRWLGLLASLQLVANLISVNMSIYRLKIESYELLMESLALYLSINLCFVFWYWYWDYPLRDSLPEDSRQAAMPLGIMFPEEQMEQHYLHADDWLPGPVDYLYFTILSSNCFGSPEGHLLIGSRLKLLQMIHTIFMILVFIIIVARAINTLG